MGDRGELLVGQPLDHAVGELAAGEHLEPHSLTREALASRRVRSGISDGSVTH